VKLLPINTPDEHIQQLIAQWSETLSRGDFIAALELCPPDVPQWTASELKKTIAGYGDPDCENEGWHITSLYSLPNHVEIIAKSIEVDRLNLYGMPTEEYLGMVHYENVPLNGKASDLTALFNIKKHNLDMLFLEFHNIRVM